MSEITENSPINLSPSPKASSSLDNLPEELCHNGLRDYPWALASAANMNLVGQTAVGAALPMLVAVGQTAALLARGEKLTGAKLRKIWAAPVAATLAIPMWEAGRQVGAHLGKSALASGLAAAPFAGIFEGFTQWGVKYAFDYATNPVTRQMWREDPRLMSALLTKELLLNVTVGAIPGAVWQLVYFLVLGALQAQFGHVGGALLTAIAVQLAVMLCNYVCAHVNQRLSCWIDKKAGWDEQLEALRRRAIAALALGAPLTQSVATVVS